MNYDITQIVIGLIGVISALITAFLIPYIRTKTSTEQFEELVMWTEIAVSAAEQVFGSKSGAVKKDYVEQFLKTKGIVYNSDVIDKAIEAAVLNLKMNGGESK